MIHSVTRITSFLLVFGFFIGCSTLSGTKENQRYSQELSEAELNKRLDSLNTLIQNQRASSEILYEKGQYLAKLALKREDPEQRTPIYRNVHDVLQKSIKIDSGSDSFNDEKVLELLKVSWSHEHNEGVRILQQDSLLEDPDYLRAAAHFNNATVIIPDSSISYEMEARAYYKNQQEQKAIETLEEARNIISDVPSSLLEQLAFLYLETDRPQKAIETYERAEPFSGQNLNLLHGLSNAYITAEEHQKAIELLQSLVESKPENIIYRHSLATELYFLSTQKLDSVISALQNGATLEETGFKNAGTLIDRAEKEYRKVLEANPQEPEILQSLSRFYQNMASKYQKLLPLVDEEKDRLLKEEIKRFLSSSVPLLEQLAEQQPDDKQVWKSLYQAYSYLGMEEKAEKAKSNF